MSDDTHPTVPNENATHDPTDTHCGCVSCIAIAMRKIQANVETLLAGAERIPFARSMTIESIVITGNIKA